MNLRLKDILEEKGISLVVLSERTGIEKGNLSSIANNKKNPTVETLERISNALGIQIWELFTSSLMKDELTALIDHKGKMYHANSIEELKSIVDRICIQSE